jgi:hypothetical protein
LSSASAGWFEPEHRTFGVEFPPPPDRVGRFREAVDGGDGLRRNERSYAGRYYDLRDGALPTQPRPRWLGEQLHALVSSRGAWSNPSRPFRT